ncbi:MAG TPA: hypothetical protein VGG72_22690 [Bryobacteraceae bacterium]
MRVRDDRTGGIACPTTGTATDAADGESRSQTCVAFYDSHVEQGGSSATLVIAAWKTLPTEP